MDYPGTSVQFDSTWAGTLDKLEAGIAALEDLQDPQLTHALLRACLDAGKVMALLRISDVTKPSLRTHVDRAYNMILTVFEECVGGGMTPTAQLQASLYFRSG